uniref:Uncharacterized protein n=1 Tax=Oryza rufipogon TaxID=4529 RepID=A0A0E0PM53_ORYRU
MENPVSTPIPTGESVHGIPLAFQTVGTGNNQHLIVPFNQITFVRPTLIEIGQNGALGGLVMGNVPTATSVLARAFRREMVNGAALSDH